MTFHKAGTVPCMIDLLIRYVVDGESSTSLAGILSSPAA